DPFEEAAQQLFEQAPHSLEYVPRDHVPVFVPEFEHPEDLVPIEEEAHASLLPSGFLSPRIQTRKALAKSEAYCRALEARVAVLETHVRRLEWQRQAADDLAIRTLGPDAYTVTWSVLKKKITYKYCPLGEVKKLEIELWNLKVRDNNIPA
nr:reverse transcriptase domain-containing protein [Tanacetum cinerariifolium]